MEAVQVLSVFHQTICIREDFCETASHSQSSERLFRYKGTTRVALQNCKDFGEVASKLRIVRLRRRLFYQACKPLHITGFRSTEIRIKDMGLRDLLKGKRVLDIGTNAGFIPLECADVCQSIDAFDINPFLIEIAQTCAKFLHLDNIRFWSGTFEEYNEAKTYDVVLPFANHSTYDHNTKQSLDDYFRKCHRYVIDGGMLLFESHLPSYETPEQLNKVLEVLGKCFSVEKSYKLNRGTAGDRGRMFAVCRKQQ